ncbi:LOW QUALITY PROTEIN: hypothetical protein HZS_3683 [Henneguya salminicola]|nr:LOW QUALITY PROTEIN: hypothetical protein HZS_3683 [Henneguya salminicola]
MTIKSRIIISQNKKDGLEFKNSNISLNFQKISSILSNILRSEDPLFIDAEVIVLKEAIDLFTSKSSNLEKYLQSIFTHLSKTTSIHNLLFSVKKVEYWKKENMAKPTYIWDLNSYANYIVKKNLNYDTYIFLGSFNDRTLSQTTFDSFCTSQSVQLINILDKKTEPETVANLIAHEIGHALGWTHNNGIYIIYNFKSLQLCFFKS